MSAEMKIEGFKGLEKALLDLPRGTAIGVVRRVLKKQLAPIASEANAYWPGADDNVFIVSSKLSRSQKSDSAAKFTRSVVNMFVGATAPQAHLLEFGTGPRYHKSGKYTGAVSPMPMLQPAWDGDKRQLLARLGDAMWAEIKATQARRAARAAKGR